LSRVNAATVMSVFFVAVIVGRLIGARLTRRYPTQRLLLGALGLALAGFPLFWLMPVAVLNILGLFVTGLGVANLFPFTLAVAVGTAPGQADAASSRLSLVVGSAILLAPLSLGWLADQHGIFTAYGLVPPLLLTAIGAAITAEKVAR
jgi:fucose permease